jgi:hypothetical protein
MQACMSCTEYKALSSAASQIFGVVLLFKKGLVSILPSDGGGRRPPGRSFPKVHLARSIGSSPPTC